MYGVKFDIKFEKKFSKIKNLTFKNQIIKQIEKIQKDPTIGKPMRYQRKGTRELYIKPYRLSYEVIKNEVLILFLDIYHKNEQ
jgi:addiction module RelE/StbE family toxin